MVDVGLLDHGAHRLGNIAGLKLVVRVFVPDGFEVEVGPVHEFLEESQVAGVADGFVCVVVAVRSGCGEGERACGGVRVGC